MKESNNDFFAPRPKSSRNERRIRFGAALVAIEISFLFLFAEIDISRQIFRGGFWENSLLLFLLTILQLLVLVICWRAWTLRLWACRFLMIFLFISPFLTLLYSFWLGLFSFVLCSFPLEAINHERDYLDGY